MHRPRLETLERRWVPATLQPFGGSSSDFAPPMASPMPDRGIQFAWPTDARSAPNFDPAPSDDAVFLASRPLEPLMSQLGRLPAPELEFSPSGNGGGAYHVSFDILPATAPATPAPTAEQIDELFIEPEAEPLEE